MAYNSQSSFLSRDIWRVAGIIALLAILILLFKSTIHIFILIMVGALMACYFLGLGHFVHEKLNWGSRTSMLIAVLGTVLIFCGFLFFLGARIVAQTDELTHRLPELLSKAKDYLSESELGEKVIISVQNMDLSEKAESFLSGFFQTTFGGIGDIYVIFLIGLYFTFSPHLYKRGIINFVPPRSKAKAEDIIEKLSKGLTNWIFGKFISMSLVFVLTAIALSIIGIPLWLPLAFIAGALVFIPNFGPLISAIPTVLVALSVSLNTAILVGILFFVIQIAEGSVITPKVQDHLIKIPPALIILGQIFAGTLIGVWGLVFATPIVLILKILVEELYLKPINGGDGEILSLEEE